MVILHLLKKLTCHIYYYEIIDSIRQRQMSNFLRLIFEYLYANNELVMATLPNAALWYLVALNLASLVPNLVAIGTSLSQPNQESKNVDIVSNCGDKLFTRGVSVQFRINSMFKFTRCLTA